MLVSQLFIYPIKSLGGISVQSAVVTDRGFQYDRRWMLIDRNNRFMTQREMHALSLFRVSIKADGLHVRHKAYESSIIVPFEPAVINEIVVQIWKDTCPASLISTEIDAWFSEMLSMDCRLVYMPDETTRLVDKNYASHNEITSFSDAYPFLIIGQASLDDLNTKLDIPLPMNRFRPNIVFEGGEPFQEDSLGEFIINDIHFFGVKPCGRCVVTTIDQETSAKGTEPLVTLSRYRQRNNKVYFGQNLLHRGRGTVNVGDELVPVSRTAFY